MKQLRKTKNVLIGGATAIKAADMLGHAGNVTAGDVQGFVGIGIAGAMADLPFRMMQKRKRKGRYL